MYIKLLALTVSLLLIFSLCACSKDSEQDSETSRNDSETTSDSSADEFVSGGVVIENTKDTSEADVSANGNGNDVSEDSPSSGSNDESSKDTVSTDSEGSETGEAEETTKDPADTGDNNTSDTKDPAVTPDKDTSDTKEPSNGEGTTSKPDETEKTPAPEDVSYEEYHAMTSDDQQAFFNSFDSVEAFFDWYNAAKAKYEAENPDKEIGDGGINLGDLIG